MNTQMHLSSEAKQGLSMEVNTERVNWNTNWIK